MIVRTVLGDVTPTSLGPADYHEHLFQVSPLLPGDELDDEPRSSAEAAALHDAGIATMVDATPAGLGRNAPALARISSATGLHIIATTGAHRRVHYRDGHPILDLDGEALTTLFRNDLVHGIREPRGSHRASTSLIGSGGLVRAGVVKAAIGYWSIGKFERRVLDAVAAAAVMTGAPVMVHTEHGSAGFEVLEILANAGVAPHRVVLAHIDRNPDPGLHAELAATGCYLGYDGMARHREWPDSLLIDCLIRAAELGAAEHLLLGGDVARATRYRAYGGLPGLDYLPKRFIPRLRVAAGAELAGQILRENPARWLTWTPVEPAR